MKLHTATGKEDSWHIGEPRQRHDGADVQINGIDGDTSDTHEHLAGLRRRLREIAVLDTIESQKNFG